MKCFRFRLASLENIRRLQVDELQQALALRRAELRRAEDGLLELRAALDDCYSGIARERSESPDPAVLASLEGYSALLRQRMQTQAQHIMELRRELELAQRRLLARHREQKVLEKLRERQFAEYSLKEQRETQQELDEAARHAHLPDFTEPSAA